ncbi:hypothetical protein AAZV13_17G038300 [Glycine max]
MKTTISCFYRNPVKFRMPTAENLVPIRLDIEIEGQRYKDALTWNPSDPDSEVVVFAKRTAKDLKLPPVFVTQIAQSIQDMYSGEKIVPIKLDLRVNHTLVKDQFLWDSNNFESDPKEFARLFCKDTGIEDPEVGPAIAFAIREQLNEIAIQSVVSARESRMSKKGGAVAVDLVKLFGPKSSVVRVSPSQRDSLFFCRAMLNSQLLTDLNEPIVDLLSNEEVDALEAKEERNFR